MQPKLNLKKALGNHAKKYCSKSRLEEIVSISFFDFETKPRLNTGEGNAMLVLKFSSSSMQVL
jgi:type I restriction enzyme R subunit